MKKLFKYFLGGLAWLSGLLLAFYAYEMLNREKHYSKSGEALNAIKEGESVFEKLTLVGLDGSLHQIGDYRGKTLLVNYWAEFCAPCMIEMPDIYSLQKKYRDRGLEVLALSFDEEPVSGTKGLEAKFGPVPFTVFRGNESEIGHVFRSQLLPANLLPTTAIVDKLGVVRHVEYGRINPEKLTRLLEEVL